MSTVSWRKTDMAPTISLLCIGLVLAVLTSPVFCQLDFVVEAWQGAGDMWDAYRDMREANYIGADKYFHARGNHEAAERGPGGEWIAGVISDAREALQFGRGAEDSAADQVANEWGREGGDPNKYRPEGLPDKY